MLSTDQFMGLLRGSYLLPVGGSSYHYETPALATSAADSFDPVASAIYRESWLLGLCRVPERIGVCRAYSMTDAI
jgi:hypothetical protein